MSTPETPTGRKTTIDTQPSTDEPDVIDDATTEVEETTSDATSDDADEAADAGDHDGAARHGVLLRAMISALLSAMTSAPGVPSASMKVGASSPVETLNWFASPSDASPSSRGP